MHRFGLFALVASIVVCSARPAIAQQAPSQPTPSADQTVNQPLRVGGNIKPPTKVKHVPPVYPKEAQQARIQGVVIIEAVIGIDGKVTDARILRSIPQLDQASLDAVKQWEFTPTFLNGVAVPVIMTVTVQFTLDGPPAASPFPPGSVPLAAEPKGDGTTLVWSIDAARARSLAQANPEVTATEPISSVIRRARESLVSRGAVGTMSLEGIIFRRPPPEHPAVWYYHIIFAPTRGAASGTLTLQVVVLADGSIVEPTTATTASRPLP